MRKGLQSSEISYLFYPVDVETAGVSESLVPTRLYGVTWCKTLLLCLFTVSVCMWFPEQGNSDVEKTLVFVAY